MPAAGLDCAGKPRNGTVGVDGKTDDPLGNHHKRERSVTLDPSENQRSRDNFDLFRFFPRSFKHEICEKESAGLADLVGI